MKNTLVFDIGKTNKKVFIFDEQFNVVHSEQRVFDEIQDDDGFPCDDLLAIKQWIKETTQSLILSKQWNIQKINFSTYGASFVHLNELGNPLTPLYNYLKPMPKQCSEHFHQKNGVRLKIALETSSPPLDMLNAGFQIYWLKFGKDEIFSKIKRSLHFPQYLSYCFTQKAVSEYTSIGCHTALWNFSKKDYHDWVKDENINDLLPPIVPSNHTFKTDVFGKKIEIGVGIHDSSAALIPYLKRVKTPFLLISTGTWSISLNPFNNESLTPKELEQDCLNYLRVDGQPVKAARLFLGQEYQFQIDELIQYFQVSKETINTISFDKNLIDKKNYYFNFKHLKTHWKSPKITHYNIFKNIKAAYHQLMFELVELQFASAQLAIGNTEIKQIFIDGGFVKNDLYLECLKLKFPSIPILQMNIANGSALGAAMVINEFDAERR